MVIETLKCNHCCEGTKLEYIYRLIQRELAIEHNGEACFLEAYGIEVESKIEHNENCVQGFREEIKYVTPYKYKGSKFLHMLAKNMVSPIHLVDIAEEIIDEYYKDFDKELTVELNKLTV